MTTEQRVFSFTGVAAGALSSYPYHLVKFNGTNNTIAICNGAADIPCGVIQNAADVLAAGDPVEVMALGKTKIELGATLTSGALICTHTDGHAIAAIGNSYSVGQIVDGGDSGDLGSANINCMNPCLKAA